MSEQITAYLENLKNPKHKEHLEQLQAYLKEQLPDAEVTMQYGMPTYEQNNQVVVTIASQKNYMSLYMDVDLLEAHKDAMAGLNCGKSCVRFKKFEDLPIDTISTIIQETVKRQREQADN